MHLAKEGFSQEIIARKKVLPSRMSTFYAFFT
jgi:hypothetical protein